MIAEVDGRALVLAAFSMALGGCAVGPDYRAPTLAVLRVPARYSVSADASAQANHARWWTHFDDPLLTRLETEGQTANRDLAVARARLRQSREALIQTRSAAMPTVAVTAGLNRNQRVSGGGLSGTVASLSGDAAYQVDLFGANARAIAAARADAEASRFATGAVALTIAADIATAYLQVRLAQADLANAALAEANLADNLQIAQWRNQAGLNGALDVELARTQLAQTSATIPAIEAALAAGEARIAVLVGRDPGALRAELAMVAPIPVGAVQLAVGIPADAVRQRPDVRAAERALAAATARIGVAQAQLYPALGLGGSVGTGAAALSNPFAAITGQAFATLTHLVFDGGRRHSVVRQARAQADEALASYQQSVLIALEETENALVTARSVSRQQAQVEAAAAAAANSALLARQQYRSGLIDYAALIVTENLLISARNGVVQARHDRALALVQLYSALGGGWTDQDFSRPQDIP